LTTLFNPIFEDSVQNKRKNHLSIFDIYIFPVSEYFKKPLFSRKFHNEKDIDWLQSLVLPAKETFTQLKAY